MRLADGVDKLLSHDGLQADQWYHVVIKRDSSLIIFYLDGREINIWTKTSETFTTPILTQLESMIIGSNSRLFNESLSVVIDDIKIYNYALYHNTIQELYTEGGWPSTHAKGISAPKTVELPEDFALYQNYPNPFNPSTTINFDLPEMSVVSLKVFDITGRLVATLVDGSRSAGKHQVDFIASNLSSGVYFYELQTNQFRDIKKFTLIK